MVRGKGRRMQQCREAVIVGARWFFLLIGGSQTGSQVDYWLLTEFFPACPGTSLRRSLRAAEVTEVTEDVENRGRICLPSH
jgi:hypothetical protein